MARVLFWLKLPKDFFRQKEIKKLRTIAGGDTYTIIYQKLLLLSLETNGRLYYENLEDTFAEELALIIDEDPLNVDVTLKYLLSTGLMEECSTNETFLTRIPEMTGKETDKAAIMRRKREREKRMKADETPLIPEREEWEKP